MSLSLCTVKGKCYFVCSFDQLYSSNFRCFYSHKSIPKLFYDVVMSFFKSRLDPYGFERSVDFDYASYEELMSEYLVVLTRRSIKWSKLLKGKGKVQKNVKCACENTKAHRAKPPCSFTERFLPLLQ